MEEEQVPEEFELRNAIVGCSYGLLSLKTSNTYSNIGCSDHIHIISTITDC